MIWESEDAILVEKTGRDVRERDYKGESIGGGNKYYEYDDIGGGHDYYQHDDIWGSHDTYEHSYKSRFLDTSARAI